MSPRAWTERVQDILRAISEIQVFTQGMTFDTFQGDAKTNKAVQLDFIVIGEAASHIPDDVQAAHPEVSWHLMRAMRNRLVHVYFSIEPKIIWDTMHYDLPPLIQPLTQLLVEGETSKDESST